MLKAAGAALVVAVTLASAASASSAAEPSTAYQLAALDCRCHPKQTDPGIRAYRVALSNLSTKCKEPPARLADFSQVGWVELHKAGRDKSRLTILRAVNTAIPKVMGKTRCADIFVALITLLLDERK